MYIQANQVPVFGAEWSPLLAPAALTQTQKDMCERAKKLLPNMPWATSPECGLCPPPIACPDCPAPIDCPDCPAPIDCPSCPDLTDYALKTDASSSGLKWYWLLVAAAGGIAVGAAGAAAMTKKRP